MSAPRSSAAPSTSTTISATSAGHSRRRTATAGSACTSGRTSAPTCSWSTSRGRTRRRTSSATSSGRRGLTGELAAQQERFGGTVEAMYRYADRVVGEYMDAMDAATTLVVLSDHGFELGVLPDDPSKTRDMRRVSERYHRLEGIFYLYGNRVRPHTRLDQPRILDVAPTIIALAGLDRAAGMPGSVMQAGVA